MVCKSSRVSLDGWLISPEGKWCYRFHRDPKGWQRYPFIFVDKWEAMPDGLPSSMKKRSKLPLDEALELCGNMLLDGWNKLETQFDDGSEPFLEEFAA